ncbi:hypothetical protein ACFV1L_10570 [Kitasatospora sp. NPDC059646]|uniref:hypothetical protein n=1 Tax=Kitasatospora sp. NPDC059646 TaxID=3346893 RepID=UPI00367F3D07
MTHTPWHIRTARKLGQPAVLYAALALSAPGEFSLGVMAGWDWRVAWLMPAVLSLYAAWSARNARDWSAIVREHRTAGDATREKDARRQRGSAIRGALLALIVATAAQITEHVLTTGVVGPRAWVVVIVSAVPPLVAAHVLHLDAPPTDEPGDAGPGDDGPADAPAVPGPAVPPKVEINKLPLKRLMSNVLQTPELKITSELLSIPDAARRLGIQSSTLYRRRDAGTLTVHEGPRGRQMVLWSDLQPVNALP